MARRVNTEEDESSPTVQNETGSAEGTGDGQAFTAPIPDEEDEDPGEDMSFRDLQAEARELGISSGGKKDELLERVLEAREALRRAQAPPVPGVISQRPYKSLEALKDIFDGHPVFEGRELEFDLDAGTVTVSGASREDAHQVASNVIAIGTGNWELASDYVVDDETWKTVVRRKE
jgi:hypothetical protein